MLTIEQLQQKQKEISQESLQIKELSDQVEKKKRQEGLIKKIDDLDREIDKQLQEIENKNDQSLSAKVEQLRQIKLSLSEDRESLSNLKQEVLLAQDPSTQAKKSQLDGEKKSSVSEKSDKNEKADSTATQPQKKSKNFFWKTKDFTKEQWEAVWDGEKRNQEAWKNSLRTLGFVATGIGAVALAYKGIKSLFGRGKKKEKAASSSEASEQSGGSKKKTPRWKKGLLRAGGILWVGAAATWTYKNFERIKGKFFDVTGQNLTFEEALIKAEADMYNSTNEAWMGQNLNFEYLSWSSEVLSYGEKVKIDVNKKRVEGLDVQFSTYEHMLAAANIINYIKYAYKWKCSNPTPFSFEKWDWDVKVNTGDSGQETAVSGQWVSGKIVWVWTGALLSVLAGVLTKSPKVGVGAGILGVPAGLAIGSASDANSTLNKIAPPLSKDIWRKKLEVYLNSLGIWIPWNQTIEEPDSKHALQPSINQVIREIESSDTSWNIESLWWQREIHAELEDPQNPNSYAFYSWWNRVQLTYAPWWSLIIEGLDIEFSDPKEGVRVANLINKMKKEYPGQGARKDPFYVWPWPENDLFIKKSGFLNTFKVYKVLSRDAIKKYTPSLLKDSNLEKKYVPYLNGIKDPKRNRSRRLK